MSTPWEGHSEGMMKAPFTEDEVASFNAYQESGVFHPFTCGKDHEVHVNLVATTECLVCPTGDGYEQYWAWDWMLDWGWEETFKRYGGLIEYIEHLTSQVDLGDDE